MIASLCGCCLGKVSAEDQEGGSIVQLLEFICSHLFRHHWQTRAHSTCYSDWLKPTSKMGSAMFIGSCFCLWGTAQLKPSSSHWAQRKRTGKTSTNVPITPSGLGQGGGMWVWIALVKPMDYSWFCWGQNFTMSLFMRLKTSSPTLCKAKHLFLLRRTAAGHEGGWMQAQHWHRAEQICSASAVPWQGACDPRLCFPPRTGQRGVAAFFGLPFMGKSLNK